MEVDTTPTKSSVNPDKLCNGSTNGDLDAEKPTEKVKNGTKVNGVHADEPMEVEETNGVAENNGTETESNKLENGDSKIAEDSIDSTNEAEETKDVEETTDTADDSVQVLDSSSAQNISDSSVLSESVDSNNKDVDGDKEEGKDKDDQTLQEKDKKEGEKSECKAENKSEDKDKEIKDTGKEGESSKSTEEEGKNSGDKNEKEKKEGSEEKEIDEDKDTKDDSNKDKDKDKTEESVDLTEDKSEKPESSTQSSSKSRISAVLKTPSPSTQMRPMAGLLFDLGMDLARQQVYKDLIRIQQKKQSMDKLDEKETRQLDKLKEAYDDLVAKNSPYTTDKEVACEKCEFKADLDTVYENHKEYGHVNEAGVIKCSFCGEHFKVSQQYIVHMEQKHKRKGRVVVRHSFFVCPFCPFEHNSKASFNKHILRCERVFNLLRNLEPTPADCDIPIKLPKPPVVAQPKPKPPTVAQAAAAAVHRKQAPLGRPPLGKPQQVAPRGQVMPAPIRMTHQQAASATIRPQMVTGVPPGSQVVQVGNQWYHMVNLNGQRFLTPVPPGTQVPNNTPPTTGVVQPPRQQSSATSNKSPASSKSSSKSQLQSKNNNKDKGTFEICEICGGFVKDRDSLRIHFFWAHKVDIQKDVFNSKSPNLICDRCNFRCWTVAGMQRHKSMAHKDASRLKDKARQPFYCTLCRPTPELLHTETFWLHMAAKHRIGPDSVFMQKQCVVCGVPNVGVPQALETHMLNVHNHLFSVDLLQLARKLLAPNTGLNPNAAQQAVVTPTKSPSKRPVQQVVTCDHCDSVFNTMNELELHNNYEHSFKCSRCKTRLSSREMLTKHFHDKHKDDKDPCTLCGSIIAVGRPMVRHMRSNHLKDCSVVITRLPQKEVDKRMERYIQMFGHAGSAYRTPTKGRKRLRSPAASEPVIVLEETPVKKSRTSATRKAVSEERRKAMKIKDVIEVDGEEILVEMQQDEDEDDSVTVVTIDNSHSKSDSPTKKDKKQTEPLEPQTVDGEDKTNQEKVVDSEKNVDKGNENKEAMDTSERKENRDKDDDKEESKTD